MEQLVKHVGIPVVEGIIYAEKSYQVTWILLRVLLLQTAEEVKNVCLFAILLLCNHSKSLLCL